MTSGPVLRSLTGDRAFQRLRKGRSGGSKHLSIRLRPTRLGVVRVGFVVSRKVGNAVTRNRVRRRLREALRAMLQGGVPAGERPSYDLLVITRPSAAEADYHALAESLRRALERALSEPRTDAGAIRESEPSGVSA